MFELNGTRLHVEEAGAGPAVVFLHGFTLMGFLLLARKIHIGFVE
ncbi:MAG TPA: hypothetical protein PKM78_01215 [Anaerolineae bacterium]|nr:hypothetical protein [Anaerolineae bacterium]HNU03270.1 hypothetical protein [Anaerolineae bacterium]